MDNVFETPTGELVSIVNDTNPEEIKVLSAKDDSIKTFKKSELRKTRLVSGAPYSEKFIQASLKGVTKVPFYVTRDLKVFQNDKMAIFDFLEF